jgi:methyl-accepting chemotaxis protein
MRTNLPVTQNEVSLEIEQSLVSKTDLKGQITYINQSFIDVSGFSQNELIGQSHNIVRHPDMPSEVFADLWETLKAGRPWTGIVKNRCKNGDHYWVEANATPIYENGVLGGYMSVRTAASREQVSDADRAYQLFRDGSQKRLAISEGRVIKTGFSLGVWLKRRSIAQRIFGMFWLLTAGLLLVGGLGVFAVNDENQRLKNVYDEHVVPLQQLKQVADAYAVSVVDLSHKARDGAETFESSLAKVEQAQGVIRERWQQYSAGRLTDGEKKLVVEAAALMKKGDLAILRLKELLVSKDVLALTAFAATDLYPAIDPISNKLGELVELQLRVAKAGIDQASGRSGALLEKLVLLILVVGLLGVFFALSLVRGIRQPIADAAAFFRALSEGRSNVKLDFERRDELTVIADAARSMQIKSGFDINEARRVAREAMRIKIGLDNVATNVMIADVRFDIIYLNKSIQAMFAIAESCIQKDLPLFNAAALCGANIDLFHKNPAHQRALLSKLTGSHRATIQLGGRAFNLAVTPVIDQFEQRHGYVIEWVDRTMEVAVENEVAEIVSGAARGDFTRRVSLDGKQGFFLRLANELNTLMQTSHVGLEDVVRVFSGMAEGDLTRTIEADYAGTFGQLKDDANQTVYRLTEIVSRIRLATDAIYTAAREIATGNQNLSSRTEEQAGSLEETASSMEQLSGTVRLNADNARRANDLASNAQLVAIKGGEAVEQVVNTMTAIHHSSSKIADIIGVIDSIAFQTNILALNAAVEAARAGEQGRGFAVVASEVRILAKRSAEAAKEIKRLISDSVGKVESGNRQVAQAGRTMVEVVGSIKEVARLMEDISSASREQSTGILQVSQAVSQMDEVTQQNAALVEQAAAAAESLEAQAHHLAEAVAVFKLADNGGSARIEAPLRAIRQAQPRRLIEKPSVLLASSADDQWEEF